MKTIPWILILLLAGFLPASLTAATADKGVIVSVKPILLLDLSYIKNVRDLSDQEMAYRLSHHPELIGLNLSGQKVGPETAQAIHTLHDLKYLYLSGNYWHWNETMHLSPEFISALAKDPLPVTTLSLSESSIDDKQLEQLSRAMPLLEEIDLRGCVSISDNGIIALVENCPHLKILHLGAVKIAENHFIKTPVTESAIQYAEGHGIKVGIETYP